MDLDDELARLALAGLTEPTLDVVLLSPVKSPCRTYRHVRVGRRDLALFWRGGLSRMLISRLTLGHGCWLSSPSRRRLVGSLTPPTLSILSRGASMSTEQVS